MSKSALATVAIFRFMWSWNDFFGPLIYLSDGQLFTLPLGLAFFQGSPESPVQMHLLMAMAVIIALPCVVLFFLAQRLFIQGIVFTGVKG
jgi:multiple sugar transport system permease protein/sn-glycerol 3-phosphate transport system permease protein